MAFCPVVAVVMLESRVAGCVHCEEDVACLKPHPPHSAHILQHHNSYDRTESHRQWNAVWPPDDGRKDARNMLRNNWLPVNHYLLRLVGLAFYLLTKDARLFEHKIRNYNQMLHWLHFISLHCCRCFGRTTAPSFSESSSPRTKEIDLLFMFLEGWKEEIAQKSQFATYLRIAGDSVDLSSLLIRRPCPTSGFSPRCNFFSLSNQTPQVHITYVYVIFDIQYFTRRGKGHPMICLYRHRMEAEV
jgi:hypothetical protein